MRHTTCTLTLGMHVCAEFPVYAGAPKLLVPLPAAYLLHHTAEFTLSASSYEVLVI